MQLNINRPPVGTTNKRSGDDGRNIRLRVSDGRSWAYEFSASGPDDLRDGCFDGFVELAMEWRRRADMLPAHQTIKRAAHLRSLPTSLELHVAGIGGDWVGANYGTDCGQKIIVRTPARTATPHAWGGSDWQEYWGRCARADKAIGEMRKFLAGLPKFLDDSIGGVTS